MKAFVIAPQPFFSPRGTPFSVYYRTLVMAQLGVRVDLLTYGDGADVEIPGVRIIRIPRFPWLGTVRVGPSLLKLFLDVFLMMKAIWLLLRDRYDFVHAHEEAMFFCLVLKPIFGFKLIYDMHSSLPQQLTNFSYTKSRLLIGVFEKLERTSVLTADVVITICPALARYVNGIIDDQEKHILIENSIYEKVQCVPSASTVEKLQSPNRDEADVLEQQKDRKCIVYAGTLESYQGIELLLRAFREVQSKDEKAFLIIVGGTTAQVDHYRSVAENMGLMRNCIFAGRVTQATAQYYNSLAAVLVSPRVSGTNTPLKIYEQLDSGIPLVATRISSHTQVLSEEGAFLVNPDPDDIACGILEALNSPELARHKASAAKALYRNKYSRRVYESKMRKCLSLLKPDAWEMYREPHGSGHHSSAAESSKISGNNT